MGTLIFSFFNITIDAFKIVGGILFLRIGLDMVESKVSRTKSTPQEEKEASTKEEVAYSPLGVPLIAGPGAITSVMILSNQVSNSMEKTAGHSWCSRLRLAASLRSAAESEISSGRHALAITTLSSSKVASTTESFPWIENFQSTIEIGE